jgi:hypothetical protein
MTDRDFVIEEVSDPDEIRRSRAQDARHHRNSAWVQAHWRDILPQTRGKFIAVAGQEAFIAATPAEAWASVETTHPEDHGAIVRYVRTQRGPRLYADRW